MSKNYSCPRCHADLWPADGDHGEYFRCGTCPGHLVPMAVLLGAGDRREVRHLWREARRQFKRGPHSGRPCLKCQQPMVIVPVKTAALDADSEVDICTIDRLIWLDETSLDRTLARVQSEGLSPSAQTALHQVGVGLGGKKGEQFSVWDVAEVLLACLTNGMFSIR